MNENQTKSPESGVEIDIVGILRALLSKIWLIIIVVVIGAVAGRIYSKYFITPKYDSTVSIYVLNTKENTAVTYADTQLSLQIIRDYKEMISCPEVLWRTAKQLYGLSDNVTAQERNREVSKLRGKVSLSNEEETRIIKIIVRDEEPQEAKRIADALCQESSAFIQDIISMDAVKPLGEAVLPTSPASPSVSRWTMLCGLIAGFVIVVILVVIFLLDNTIKTAEDIEKYLQWPTLASIPMKAGGDKKGKKDTTKKKGKKG